MHRTSTSGKRKTRRCENGEGILLPTDCSERVVPSSQVSCLIQIISHDFFISSIRAPGPAGTPRLLPPPSRTPPRSPSQTSRMNDSDSPPSLALGSMNFYASIGAASARNARARYNARSSSPTSASSPPASAPGTAGAGASSEPLDAAARGADDTLASPLSQDLAHSRLRHAGNKVAIVNAVISASRWERVKMPFGEIKMTRLMKACAKGTGDCYER